MNREEIIEILIEDKINEYVHAKCYEGLEWILNIGWKGYENFAEDELQEEFENLIEENFDKEKAEKIRIEKLKMKGS